MNDLEYLEYEEQVGEGRDYQIGLNIPVSDGSRRYSGWQNSSNYSNTFNPFDPKRPALAMIRVTTKSLIEG